jgi:hypothetical protein
MKFMKLTFTLATLALAVASAASHYNLKLDRPTSVGETALKAGDYRIEMVGDKAVFTSGKTVVQVPATLGKSDQKYSVTSYDSIDSKIKEIHLGGTSTRIIFGTVSTGGATGSK